MDHPLVRAGIRRNPDVPETDGPLQYSHFLHRQPARDFNLLTAA